ncbi:hypothetical protein WCE55_10240 [Luteimonas sp. MJ293]|uniref:hypothetical protein n=1 Tax=Luteimonas sp. MJ146 TaxID=3129240 RepID=UPI0031BAD3DB
MRLTGKMQGLRGRIEGGVRLLAGFALLSMLGACATTSQTGAPDYAGLMAQAEAAIEAGQVDHAVGALSDAARADPIRKEPWVRTAQLEFDRTNYAHAIVAAEEVLQRDPDDLVADGILTVSGFRIATGSLQRLQGRGALASATARREAEVLAGTLRNTMGPEIFAGQDAPTPTPRRSAPARRAPSAAATPARPANTSTPASQPAASGPASSNPFERIGGN